jgi:hypothetical protein
MSIELRIYVNVSVETDGLVWFVQQDGISVCECSSGAAARRIARALVLAHAVWEAVVPELSEYTQRHSGGIEGYGSGGD